ncbi:hypothetical protein ACE418_02985 [Megasphaera sp. WILCCON 0056]|uniref:hypothetical protein n=1 Tax=Megasphaera sp. WILCCON 0056 TaxID=3345340 RepID=UPI003A7FC715
MIDDKMAKMAINTIRAYCDGKKCDACVIFDACRQTNGGFRYSNGYDTVGTFEDWQKPYKKTPKFDVALYDSPLFSNYMEQVAEKEAGKVGLNFISELDKVKCYPNGTIKVWYRGEDGKTVYKGKAKCHPRDAFNPEIGIKLAMQRIAEKVNKPFVPAKEEVYFYVDSKDEAYSTINHCDSCDVLCIALGNCFRTYDQAKNNAGVIMKRIEKATELLEKLRDKGDEQHDDYRQ